MKKVLVIVMAVVMAMSLSCAAFAENGGFLDSPSKNDPVSLASATVEGVTVTAYANRASMESGDKAILEQAYGTIASTNDVAGLADGLAEAAQAKGADAADLAIADIFDVDLGEASGEVTVVLNSDATAGFVAFIHYTGNTWEVVDNATATKSQITFTVTSGSPFAIVVNSANLAPQTGESNTTTLVFAGIAAVAACGIVVLLALKKKVNA